MICEQTLFSQKLFGKISGPNTIFHIAIFAVRLYLLSRQIKDPIVL